MQSKGSSTIFKLEKEGRGGKTLSRILHPERGVVELCCVYACIQ